MAQYIGQYEVIRELGAGRSGSVYLAVGDVPGKGAERPTRRIVAIKRLRDVPDRERTLNTLRQRLALLEQAREPRFVEVYELLDDGPSIVMEYVHGVTLNKALDELKRSREQVFTEAAVEIGCELAEALHKANATPGRNGEPLGLVHQRLKPAHVMLTADANVRVLDFGTGASAMTPGARASVAAEDLLYLAPEQARREEVDGRTDLFAVGLILYELLMNEPAYKAGGTDLELTRQVSAGDLKEACRTLEQTLPALGPILRRVLQAKPNDRYRSGADLLTDLRRQLYRERGAYLKEFCEFYFGTIHPLEPAPSLDEFGGARGRRKTIDERLAEAKRGEGAAVAAAPQPRVSAPNRAATIVPEAASAPPRAPRAEPAPARPAPPRAPAPPAPAEGASMANPPGGKKSPPRPPVGGPASRATPFDPGADAPRARVGGPAKGIGERRPDETGMLEMVPLSANKDEAEANADPSATAFFAIPAPKADRAKPAPPPPQAGGPIGVSSSPMSGGPMSMGQPPMIGGPIASGPVAAGPIVQGPVAGYGAGASPFQVQGPTPTAPAAEAGQRVQSNRVYAILIAVFLLVGVAVVAAVALIPREAPKEAAVTPPPAPVVVAKTEAKAEPDTGGPPPPPVATPKPKAKAAPSTPKPAAPSSGPGTLSVSLADASQATGVEVVCPSGFRQRTALSGGKGSMASVPNESCTMFFKGGPPAQYKPVRGGASYTCKIVGTTAVCN